MISITLISNGPIRLNIKNLVSRVVGSSFCIRLNDENLFSEKGYLHYNAGKVWFSFRRRIVRISGSTKGNRTVNIGKDKCYSVRKSEDGYYLEDQSVAGVIYSITNEQIKKPRTGPFRIQVSNNDLNAIVLGVCAFSDSLTEGM
jgi:hypothetical protein